jgi:hypothetical protein
MTMPGFTAESSLYQTSIRYQGTFGGDRTGRQDIIPQLIKCQTCICASPFNCPCEDCVIIPDPLPPPLPTKRRAM